MLYFLANFERRERALCGKSKDASAEDIDPSATKKVDPDASTLEGFKHRAQVSRREDGMKIV